MRTHNTRRKDMEKFNQRLEALENNAMLAGIANKKVLTTQEAALYLGWSMSYIYKQTRLHAIPHYCPMGKMLYFDREELEKWMLRCKVHTKEEIQEIAETELATGKKGGRK